MSAGDESDLAALQQRLVTFTEQLTSIHALLETDPENGEFLTIAQDLVEVIRLTKQMIDLKLANANANAAASTTAPPVSSDGASTAPSELAFAVGSVCEALSKNVWFPARITALTAHDTCHVRYIGFGNTDDLPAASLRAVEAPAFASTDSSELLPPCDAIAIGYQCRAKYYVDAQYYTAHVTAITDDGFKVLFDGYGNSEEVPYEYLLPVGERSSSSITTTPSESIVQKPVTLTAAAQAAAAREAAAAAAASAALKPRDAVVAKAIKVPENLQVLPTDTDADKERKRKRLKHIQKLNKQIEVDNAHNLKQHDWKSFQHKAVKGNKVKGSGVLSKRGTSMFASPASVQGRVGVVGSGQGMTQFDTTKSAPTKKLKQSHGTNRPRL